MVRTIYVVYTNQKFSEAEQKVLNSMEARNISVTLEQAREVLVYISIIWYNMQV